MKGDGLLMCLLTFFFQIRLLEMAEIDQIVQKQRLFSKHWHIRVSKYPLESGGGWGLFVFHKYFLVLIGPQHKHNNQAGMGFLLCVQRGHQHAQLDAN